MKPLANGVIISFSFLIFLSLAHARGDAECEGWISTVITFDADLSGGISKSEFYNSVVEGLNRRFSVDEALQDYDSLTHLPWVYVVAYYAVTCYCQSLGLGEGCCEGDAEISLDLLDDANYKEIFCQQIDFVLKNTVAGPISPTVGPSESTVRITDAPVTIAPTTSSPTVATASPTVATTSPTVITTSPTAITTSPTVTTATPTVATTPPTITATSSPSISTSAEPSKSPVLTPITSSSERPSEILMTNTTNTPTTASPKILTTAPPTITATASNTMATTSYTTTSSTIAANTSHTLAATALRIPSPTIRPTESFFVDDTKANTPNATVGSTASVALEGHSGGNTIGISFAIIAAILASFGFIVTCYRKKHLRGPRRGHPVREVVIENREEGGSTANGTLSSEKVRRSLVLLSFIPFLMASIALGTVLIMRGTASVSNEKVSATPGSTKHGDSATLFQTEVPTTAPMMLKEEEANQTSALPLTESDLIAQSAALITKKHGKLRSGSPSPSP